MRFDVAKTLVDSPDAYEVLHAPASPVIGFGIGKKRLTPLTTGSNFCVAVFVVRKLPQNLIPGGQSAFEIVERLALTVTPTFTLDPSDVDVIEVGDEFRAQPYAGSDHASPATVNTQKWFKHPRPGTGICSPTGRYLGTLDAGTISFFAELDRQFYLISCNHVIAGISTVVATPIPAVIHPASRDLNGHDIGRLGTDLDVAAEFGIADLSYVVPQKLHNPPNSYPINTSDIAAALLRKASDPDWVSRLPFGGKFVHDNSGNLFAWDSATEKVTGTPNIHEVGRTSGYTEGRAMTVNTNAVVTYPGGKATLKDLVSCAPTEDNTGPFSTGGDSGAPILTDRHQLAGVVVGGGPNRALVVQIGTVMHDLRATMGSGLKVAL